MDPIKRLALVVALFACCLTACVSTALSGAQVAYDHHAIQHKIDNQYTSMRAYQKIYLDTKRYQGSHVVVITNDSSMLLLGQVPDPGLKVEVAGLVKELAKGRKIYNYIELGGPSSPLTRTSDAWITAKIKGQLLATNEIDATRIKVVTENGTVYLIGTVPHEQADKAVLIAQDTAGVQSIVKVFSYVYISQV